MANRKVVILTALSLERVAVRAYVSARGLGRISSSGILYDTGTFQGKTGAWDVAIVEMGMGNVPAAAIAQHVIDHLAPEVLLFVGIAGGLKDVQPGDVVAADKLYDYGSGKVDHAHEFQLRPTVQLPAFSLKQLAMLVRSDNEWQESIQHPRADRRPRAFLGAIAAGELVISSGDAPIVTFLRRNFNDALAIDMEGYGVLEAAHINSKHVEAMVIRGISDVLQDKDDPHKDEAQEVAARHAAAFAFAMLSTMAPEISATLAEQRPTLQASAPQQPQAAPQPSGPAQIFYSYDWDTRKDRELINELKKQLAIPRRNKQIQEWDISQLLPGEDREQAIAEHLQQADLFVVGLSPSYVGSVTYDYYTELEKIMEQKSRRNVIVIPVQLRKLDNWEELPTGKLQLLPRNKKPVSDDSENALAEIAREIRETLKHR
jgi:nucleoside phosphorylase